VQAAPWGSTAVVDGRVIGPTTPTCQHQQSEKVHVRRFFWIEEWQHHRFLPVFSAKKFSSFAVAATVRSDEVPVIRAHGRLGIGIQPAFFGGRSRISAGFPADLPLINHASRCSRRACHPKHRLPSASTGAVAALALPAPAETDGKRPSFLRPHLRPRDCRSSMRL